MEEIADRGQFLAVSEPYRRVQQEKLRFYQERAKGGIGFWTDSAKQYLGRSALKDQDKPWYDPRKIYSGMVNYDNSGAAKELQLQQQEQGQQHMDLQARHKPS